MTATKYLSDELLWIASVIHSHGIAVIHVGSGACRVPGCRCGPTVPVWSYTIGFAERGRPEVVTFGLHPNDAITLSNLVRGDDPDGQEVRAGDELVMLGQPVRVVAVPDEWASSDENPMGAWFRHYQIGRPRLRAPSVVQLLWGDDDDRFPGDQRCDPLVAASQPWGAALASDAWCDQPDRWLRARLVDSAQQRRFT
jgi:Domain of unknown function (DUF4262)